MAADPDIIIGDTDDPENKHGKGAKVKKFCALRKDTCPCGNKYKDVLKASGTTFTFPQQKMNRVKNAAGAYIKDALGKFVKEPKTSEMSQEAHHIVCVASATQLLAKNEEIRPVVKESVYCINKSVNMIALPRFAHTVHWYTTSRRRGTIKWVNGRATFTDAPPFKNLPNHNYDHDKYIDELEIDLNTLKGQVEEAGHNYDPAELANKLVGYSGSYRTKLKTRGIRRGGTHECWMAGMHGEDPHWYEPFSMASDGDVTEKAFPGRTFDEEVERKLEKLRSAIAGV